MNFDSTVKKYPRLTPAQIVHYLRVYRETGDAYYRNLIVLSSMRVLCYIAIHTGFTSTAMSFDDKLSEAVIGFILACEKVTLDDDEHSDKQKENYLIHGARLYLSGRCRGASITKRSCVRVYSDQDVAVPERSAYYDSYDVLMRTEVESMIHHKAITPSQRRVLYARLNEPDVSATKLAKKLNISCTQFCRQYDESIKRLQRRYSAGLLRR